MTSGKAIYTSCSIVDSGLFGMLWLMVALLFCMKEAILSLKVPDLGFRTIQSTNHYDGVIQGFIIIVRGQHNVIIV